MKHNTQHQRTLGIIGKVPPPIGGMTIHTWRLISRLDEDRLPYEFFDLRCGSLLQLYRFIKSCNPIHLHTSNSFLRLFVVFAAIAGKAKLAITFHGNLGNTHVLRLAADKWCIKHADKPVVLNDSSLAFAKPLNVRSELIPAFIPPVASEFTADNLMHLLLNLHDTVGTVFCTNAYSRVFDNNGQEIYGVMGLLDIFRRHQHIGLVISDPSGAYGQYLSQSACPLPDNVLLISEPHNFLAVIKSSDCMLRATTTDGDSLSVKEALYLGVNVIASDCVSRPPGCILYRAGDNHALESRIISFRVRPVTGHVADGYPRLVAAYREMATLVPSGPDAPSV